MVQPNNTPHLHASLPTPSLLSKNGEPGCGRFYSIRSKNTYIYRPNFWSEIAITLGFLGFNTKLHLHNHILRVKTLMKSTRARIQRHVLSWNVPSCSVIQAQWTDFNKYGADFIRWIKCNDHTIQNNIYNVHILPSIKPAYFWKRVDSVTCRIW